MHASRVDSITDTQHVPMVVRIITFSSRWTCEEMREAQQNDPDLAFLQRKRKWAEATFYQNGTLVQGCKGVLHEVG